MSSLLEVGPRSHPSSVLGCEPDVNVAEWWGCRQGQGDPWISGRPTYLGGTKVLKPDRNLAPPHSKYLSTRKMTKGVGPLVLPGGERDLAGYTCRHTTSLHPHTPFPRRQGRPKQIPFCK